LDLLKQLFGLTTSSPHLLVGLFKLGRVCDTKAAVPPGWHGAPPDRGYRVTLSVNIEWMELNSAANYERIGWKRAGFPPARDGSVPAELDALADIVQGFDKSAEAAKRMRMDAAGASGASIAPASSTQGAATSGPPSTASAVSSKAVASSASPAPTAPRAHAAPTPAASTAASAAPSTLPPAPPKPAVSAPPKRAATPKRTSAVPVAPAATTAPTAAPTPAAAVAVTDKPELSSVARRARAAAEAITPAGTLSAIFGGAAKGSLEPLQALHRERSVVDRDKPEATRSDADGSSGRSFVRRGRSEK
jgi:hypothetical protein